MSIQKFKFFFILKEPKVETGHFFKQKPSTNPFGKCRFFYFFSESDFLFRKRSFLSKIITKQSFLAQKKLANFRPKPLTDQKKKILIL